MDKIVQLHKRAIVWWILQRFGIDTIPSLVARWLDSFVQIRIRGISLLRRARFEPVEVVAAMCRCGILRIANVRNILSLFYTFAVVLTIVWQACDIFMHVGTDCVDHEFYMVFIWPRATNVSSCSFSLSPPPTPSFLDSANRIRAVLIVHRMDSVSSAPLHQFHWMRRRKWVAHTSNRQNYFSGWVKSGTSLCIFCSAAVPSQQRNEWNISIVKFTTLHALSKCIHRHFIHRCHIVLSVKIFFFQHFSLGASRMHSTTTITF